MERAPGTHWIAGWVGPRAGMDVVVKKKIPNLWRDLNPPIIQPIAQRYPGSFRIIYKNCIKSEIQGDVKGKDDPILN
jgi:hypothetical protein